MIMRQDFTLSRLNSDLHLVQIEWVSASKQLDLLFLLFDLDEFSLDLLHFRDFMERFVLPYGLFELPESSWSKDRFVSFDFRILLLRGCNEGTAVKSDRVPPVDLIEHFGLRVLYL